jgi:ubiquinone/menaquinone biosynthesis C-methylase UbiE
MTNAKATHINEQQAAAAFTRQSKIFDDSFSGNTIIQYKRKRVRDVLQEYLDPKSQILEINSGTGEDAVWLARQGHYVHATDISTGMQQVMAEKVKTAGLENNISMELCSFTALAALRKKGPYDMIFSNFAGLNCTGELAGVLHSFTDLLKPRGIITLVILPSFCLWETLMACKGKFRTASRRFFSKKGVPSRVEGISFTCWYYNPSFVVNELKDSFDLLSIEGLCTLVPPSYIEHFPEKHPALYRFLKEKEDRWKRKWPWKYMGDYYIISLQRKN